MKVLTQYAFTVKKANSMLKIIGTATENRDANII